MTVVSYLTYLGLWEECLSGLDIDLPGLIGGRKVSSMFCEELFLGEAVWLMEFSTKEPCLDLIS